MRIIFLPSIIAVSLGTWVGAAPANAQAPPCPYGYYYASDGQCYPGSPPLYPPPAYVVAPPVYQPPFVIDGFGIGIGLGVRGGWRRGGWGHGGGGRGGGGRGGHR
jgi:hypothetical protein